MLAEKISTGHFLSASTMEADMTEIKHWWALRGAKHVSDAAYAGIAYIDPSIAAGTLIPTATNMALLESFIANPQSDKNSRDSALDEIVAALLDKSAALGIQKILAFTSQKTITDRAVAHGMKNVGQYTGLYKENS